MNNQRTGFRPDPPDRQLDGFIRQIADPAQNL
jgi:hypothetical protein